MPFRGTVRRDEWGGLSHRARLPISANVSSRIYWEKGVREHEHCADRVRALQELHFWQGHDDILYNSVICGHGYVFEGRWMGYQGGNPETGSKHEHIYAHALLLGQHDPMPAEMVEAVRWVLKAFRTTLEDQGGREEADH